MLYFTVSVFVFHYQEDFEALAASLRCVSTAEDDDEPERKESSSNEEKNQPGSESEDVSSCFLCSYCFISV